MSDAEEKEADPFMQVIQDLRNRPSVSKCEEELLDAREHESGTVFLAKWNDRRSSWNGLWPTNSRKTERLSRQSGTLLSQTGTLP